MTERDAPQSLAAALEGLAAGRKPGRTEPSEARRHVRANFAAIVAARERGVTWSAIAATMTQLGIRSRNDDPVEWRALKAMFYAERDVQGGKPKRKVRRKASSRRRGALAEAKPVTPAPEVSPAAPSPDPQPSNPYAELDRQQAEATQRRRESEERKRRTAEWNPYTPTKEGTE